MAMGAGATMALMASMTAKMASLGTSAAVRTEVTLATPPVTRTVLVTVRSGDVSSFFAYSRPRLQV